MPVYLSPNKLVTTIDGKKVVASFFAPFDTDVEPFIRFATGDYEDLRREMNRDDCLATYIDILSHEIVHYQQWIKTGKIWERGVEKKASAMLRAYEKTVDHP